MYNTNGIHDLPQHQKLLLESMVMLVSDKDLSSRFSALVVQDGKYDRLLRLLYDDIQKYETEVALFENDLQLSSASSLLADFSKASPKNNWRMTSTALSRSS